MEVEGVYVRQDGVIEWTPVSNIYGDIKQYQLQLFSTESQGEIVELDRTDLMYEVNITEDVPMSGQPVFVRVRTGQVQ